LNVENRSIKSALISVFYKDGLEPLVRALHDRGTTLYSTGGTRDMIASLGIPVVAVESLTDYPAILGGRVKTLHPKIFGAILRRDHEASDREEMARYSIPSFDLVVVDLYPFEETVASGAGDDAIIEKIDIGGISLIRAAAKNHRDVLIIPSRRQYPFLKKVLEEQGGTTSLSDRRHMAAEAFAVSSAYDTAIFNYVNGDGAVQAFRAGYSPARTLRYGENPHQRGVFYGSFDDLFEQLHGKEISYNNLLDIDAAVALMEEFNDVAGVPAAARPTLAILKHNNACGLATRETLAGAWKDALAGDPVSAFGGVLIANAPVDGAVAREISQLFFEILIAPAFSDEALEVLRQKKNRILLVQKPFRLPPTQFRSLLNGVIEQERDTRSESAGDLRTVTRRAPTAEETGDLLFANRIVKHTKSNTIVLARGRQLLASGTGQTSRVDALRQAIDKARHFGFPLEGAVMASDAFFPFPDCVEIAGQAGITAVIHPGGSVKDQDSVDYCDAHGMAMVMTGTRHFKH
jgi:phosphoribosylaminoimidazolecarboxamide formyltransferase/IMP cyclohydrolase